MFLSKKPTNKIYYLFFTDELGKRRSVSTRSRLKSDAVKFLLAFKREEHERKQNLSRVPLSEFKEAYRKHSLGIHTKKTTESNQTALDQFMKSVGDLPLHKIGIREIEKFLAAKRGDASAWTARKYYIALASAFETARRWGHIIDNPFRAVAKPRVPELQPLYFTHSDFKSLLASIDDIDFRELVVTAVSTGMRLGELQEMSWDWLDFCRKVITVRNTEKFTTKNGRTRVVPMTENLCKMLLQRKERFTGEVPHVFHRQGRRLLKDYVSKTLKRYVRKAGLNEKLHFHSLRHSFASYLALEGVSLYAIQRLLGHSTPTVTQVYSHLQPEQLHSTVNRIQIALN
jgi:site-specific recombinase XerD